MAEDRLHRATEPSLASSSALQHVTPCSQARPQKTLYLHTALPGRGHVTIGLHPRWSRSTSFPARAQAGRMVPIVFVLRCTSVAGAGDVRVARATVRGPPQRLVRNRDRGKPAHRPHKPHGAASARASRSTLSQARRDSSPDATKSGGAGLPQATPRCSPSGMRMGFKPPEQLHKISTRASERGRKFD